MPSSYIASGNYALYGLPAGTTAQQVNQASILIDAYLKRSEGLVWVPDSFGNPGWMSALTPSMALTATGTIAPGSAVVVPVTGAIMGITVGDALVLDRGNNSLSEVVVVQSLSVPPAPATVTLQQVLNAHSPTALMEKGLTLFQHRYMPKDRPITTLAYTPLMRLLSGQGRYGYGRRGEASRYDTDNFNLLASLSTFGGPPAWEFFPLNSTGIDPQSGTVWVPAGVMLAYYSEVNLWYVAGFPSTGIPDEIALACAQIIKSASFIPAIGDAKLYQAGDTKIQMSATSLLSDDSKAMLAPFRAKLFL